MDNRKPFTDNRKPKFLEKKKTERVVVGKGDMNKRENLLKNAEYGYGKVEQRGNHLLYTVGSEDYGFIEYLILDAKLPQTTK